MGKARVNIRENGRSIELLWVGKQLTLLTGSIWPPVLNLKRTYAYFASHRTTAYVRVLEFLFSPFFLFSFSLFLSEWNSSQWCKLKRQTNEHSSTAFNCDVYFSMPHTSPFTKLMLRIISRMYIIYRRIHTFRLTQQSDFLSDAWDETRRVLQAEGADLKYEISTLGTHTFRRYELLIVVQVLVEAVWHEGFILLLALTC